MRVWITLNAIAPIAVIDAVANAPRNVHQNRASSPNYTPAKRHMCPRRPRRISVRPMFRTEPYTEVTEASETTRGRRRGAL